ncbi:L-lysine exporter family protein LysE/ArgO [Silvimonas terrae]|uniref:L-lysine exporter family protein LysE/ArgO n=1 Tax=Silvimonas terrae TaxID=300266 RepID=A0A840RLZ2_9NEIS|nr:LysE/ArgO family amino acid transporter [Silvimonas terrae]MBB5193548.1 L-lysine exporter family protein LysE/ArgO [Silvimonas terrae]
MMFAAWLKGLGLGGSLIMAIGGQNAHVLRMGLSRQHLGLTVLVCIVGDVLLIGAGVAGMGALIDHSPALMTLARWAGAAFLVWYGLRAWRAAFATGALHASGGVPVLTWQQAALTILALTWLNPHVYLDTVVLLGSIASQQAPVAQPWFAVGAMTASTLWFIGLGFGARLLSPVFANPRAWRVLDGLIGAVMLLLAVSLVV